MVSRSKVKITVTLNIKTCVLRVVPPYVRIFDKMVGHDESHIFQSQYVKCQGHCEFNLKMVFEQY